MKFLTIIFCLVTTICISQKQYDFDYIIEYEVNLFKDSIKIKNQHFKKSDRKFHRYYLTNSKNNDYVAIITEKDSLNYRMVFKDNNVGIFADVIFLKSDLNQTEFINIECENVRKFLPDYNFQTKNQDFFILRDTIVNNQVFGKYKLSSIKPKRIKKKKLGTTFYIIDNSTDFHIPILDFSTAYNEWRIQKKLPNGIMSERYFIDYYGNLSSHQKLLKYTKLDKKIRIPKECYSTEFIIK